MIKTLPLALLGQILPVDSGATAQTESFVQGLTAPISRSEVAFDELLGSWLTGATNFGIRVVLALLLFFVGRYAIRFVARLIRGVMVRKHVEGVALSLFNSLVIALLYIVLIVCIASVLGLQSVSFAAVLASMGLAVGMALSGQLQNLAGGVIVLVTKPFRIGDFIEAQDVTGTVESVSLFHTQVVTIENRIIYIPNGILSSGVITNITEADTRRAEWTIPVDFDSDIEQIKGILSGLLKQDSRILTTPEPMIIVHSFNTSSANISMRAWTAKDDYWDVYWAMNRAIFDSFQQAGIRFPFPQVTISQRAQ